MDSGWWMLRRWWKRPRRGDRFPRNMCVTRASFTTQGNVLPFSKYWSVTLSKVFVNYSLSLSLPSVISPDQVWGMVHKSLGCPGEPGRQVTYLEHVILRITITHPHRGDLAITLTSPSGTKSQLLAIRYEQTGMFSNFSFLITEIMIVIGAECDPNLYILTYVMHSF